MAEFSVGDVVRLKSGGPQMTVDRVEGDAVVCLWFSQAHELQTWDFGAGSLEVDAAPAKRKAAE